MKKLVLAIIFLQFALNSFAQEKIKKTPESKATKKTTEMVADLKLTKEQETMLYTTNLKAYQSLEKYDTKEHSKKDKKKQKDIVQKLREKEFKRILTPAQYKQYVALDKADDAKKDAEKKEKKKEKEQKKKNEPKSKDSKKKYK